MNFMKELGLDDNYFHINMGERANIRFEPPKELPDEENEGEKKGDRA